jgi:hypothetical protein
MAHLGTAHDRLGLCNFDHFRLKLAGHGRCCDRIGLLASSEERLPRRKTRLESMGTIMRRTPISRWGVVLDGIRNGAICVAVAAALGACMAEAEMDDGDGGDGDAGEVSCPECVVDPESGLCWLPPGGDAIDWQTAGQGCSALAVCGLVDWRLPTRTEFVRLLEGCSGQLLWADPAGGHCNPCSDNANCSALFGTDVGLYWSSTPVDDAWAWATDFGTGELIGVEIADVASARCVRKAAPGAEDALGDCECWTSNDNQCLGGCILRKCDDACTFTETDCCAGYPPGEAGCDSTDYCWSSSTYI